MIVLAEELLGVVQLAISEGLFIYGTFSEGEIVGVNLMFLDKVLPKDLHC